MINVDDLLNKDFDLGEQDCFELVRDIYWVCFGIKLTNYARPSDWRSDSLNIIVDAYQKEGFTKISNWQVGDLKPGDIMVMAVGESNPNHLGVYLGNNEFAHHLVGCLSRKEALRPFWLNSVCFLCRHPNVPDLTPIKPNVPIQELLRARYKNQAEEPPSA